MKAEVENKSRINNRVRHWLSNKWELARTWDRREVIITVITSMVILLFMYTAISKLLDYNKFVFQMRLTPIPFIWSVAPALGIVLPIFELMLVALIFFDRTRLFGFWTSLTLMFLFEGYIFWMKLVEYQTGVKLPCTCGGIISKMSWTTHFIFNAVFIVLMVIAIKKIKDLKKSKTI
ncbi:MauE/DoxX family redox-associated membrane protein [Sphingobacterium mizutaii]|uniref:MauE/DoxX family redox-associated membrane protein n=1 Tax=Sphingobacterium mizutaii TaxID=1010 RepID=UPI0016245DA6|nr:MauE/DoxX family redox-associated membrane protein [Sphingobacterium mizutaii]